MSKKVEFYNKHYETTELEIYGKIREEIYGVDLNKSSWITSDECDRFISMLQLDASSNLLEVACGNGGTAVYMSQKTQCSVIGVDINAQAVKNASDLANKNNIQNSVKFQTVNASKPLPFADKTFNSLFCNDAINHLQDRPQVLKNWHSLLQEGGKLLYTDPIIVSGILTNEEIAIRSSIGYYLFTPLGINEQLLKDTGFEVEETINLTDQVAIIAQKEYNAREKKKDQLLKYEGDERFTGFQTFLHYTYKLTDENRLSRYAFLASK